MRLNRDARHAMAWRRGRKVLKVESRTRLDTNKNEKSIQDRIAPEP
jgi:hypothetical protein